MPNESARARRAFTRDENLRLGRFLNEPDVVAWSRSYWCACGFVCAAPGEIFDHAKLCANERE